MDVGGRGSWVAEASGPEGKPECQEGHDPEGELEEGGHVEPDGLDGGPGDAGAPEGENPCRSVGHDEQVGAPLKEEDKECGEDGPPSGGDGGLEMMWEIVVHKGLTLGDGGGGFQI